MPETTMPETVVDEPGIADSPIASIDPKDAARAMAVEAAEDENGVGSSRPSTPVTASPITGSSR